MTQDELQNTLNEACEAMRETIAALETRNQTRAWIWLRTSLRLTVLSIEEMAKREGHAHGVDVLEQNERAIRQAIACLDRNDFDGALAATGAT